MAYLNTTWKHVRRSPYQAFAAIFIIAQTFFVVSMFTFLIFGSAKVITYFESLPQISAFFRDEAKQSDIDLLKQQLLSSGRVSKLKFISKEEALQIYKEQNKDDPLLLDLVTADILPASFEISTMQISDLSSVSDVLRQSPIVKEVIFPKDVVARLATWTNALRLIGTALIIVLGLDSIFLMVIIISIKVSQKREEIEILRLIGATNWYISMPFVWEGIFYGIIGAVIGWLLATSALLYTTPYLSSFLGAIPLFPVPLLFFLELFGAECLMAIVLGTISSRLAVSRYLK